MNNTSTNSYVFLLTKPRWLMILRGIAAAIALVAVINTLAYAQDKVSEIDKTIAQDKTSEIDKIFSAARTERS